MSEQPTLFDEKQVRTADAHKFVQTAPAEPEPTPEETRNAALERLKADGSADTLRARYARLLYKAAQGGIVFETGTPDDPGRRPTALTDKEAAHLLGCQNTTVIGRRNELMGGSQAPEAYQRCPVVEAHEMRRSYIRDSGQAVTAYRLIPTLFD